MRPFQLLLVGLVFAPGPCARAQVPPDVRTSHWASVSVTRAVKTGLLKLQSDGQFHGDAKVTRVEAAKALAELGRVLVDGTWKSGGRSRHVPDSVAAIWEKTSWKTETVRRYAFAEILVRLGDYVANGVPRPPKGAKVGESSAIDTVTATRSDSPATYAVAYLAANKMIQPGSPLLKLNGPPLLGGELSRSLAAFIEGVNDRLTELGKNPDGSTPDDAFHKKPGK